MSFIIILGAVVSAILMVAALAIGLQSGHTRRHLDQRLGVISGKGGSINPVGLDGNLRRREATSRVPILDRLVQAWLPNPDQLRDRLARTGREIGLGDYALWCVGAGLGGFVVASWNLQLPYPTAVLLGFILALALPWLACSVMISNRLATFLEQFPGALDLIVRGLKSGMPTTDGFAAIADEMKGPVAEEFGWIVDQIKIGVSLDDAMTETARRLDLPDFKFFAITLSIQRETGGNLAETLENLSEILRRRKQLKLKIKALSSEAKVSAYIIGALPFILFGVIHTLNPEYASVLFTDPRGHTMLIFASVWLAIGAFVMFNMARFEI